MATVAPSKVRAAVFSGTSGHSLTHSYLDLILALLIDKGATDVELNHCDEVVRQLTALVGNSIAVQEIRTLLDSQRDRFARGVN